MTKKSARESTSLATRKQAYPKSVVLIALFMTLLLLSACKPKSKPGPGLTSTPQKTPTTAPTVEPTRSINVVDSGDKLPPQVIQHTPGGGQELALTGEIQLGFDQAMDMQKTGAALQLVGPQGQAVDGKISWPTSRLLSFKPTASLQMSAAYHLTLDTAAASAGGVALSQPFVLQFDTVGPLEVSQVFPADGSLDVTNNAVITVIFNRPVVPLVIAEQQGTLVDPLTITPTVSGHGEWVNTSVFAFRADQPLHGATHYSVIVKAGLQDAGKETSLAQDYAWSFTTITPGIESLTLSNGNVNPQDGYPNFLLDDGFRLRFLQPMDRTSTQANLSITSGAGESVPLGLTWNITGTELIITPTQRLAYGTDYTLNLGTQALATDGGPLGTGLSWHFNTVGYPAIFSINPDNGTRQPNFDGMLYIKFTAPMRFDTIKDRIIVTPKPAEDIQWYYNDYDFSVSAYFMQPSTNYQVTFQAGMQDIYGSTIDKDRTIRFTTGPYYPSAGLQMPYVPSLFRQGIPQQFFVTYTNIRSYDVALYKITPNQFAFLYGTDMSGYAPAASDKVWSAAGRSTGKLNAQELISYTMTTASGDQLPPGFYFLGFNTGQIAHTSTFLDSRFFIVANTNLTLKTTGTDALVWLTGLENGKPVEGVPVTIYDKNFSPLANGMTDKDGMLKLTLPSPDQPYDKRYALAGSPGSAGQFFGFASSDWDSGVSLYDFGLWGSYYAPTNQPKAYVYTDRPIYRPGQPVYFKGVVRLDDDSLYSLLPDAKVTVKINNFQDMIYQEDLPLSQFGSFDGKFQLDTEAALGGYSIVVSQVGKPDFVGSVSFNVAEYRKPEFQVGVTAAPKDLLPGDTYSVTVKSDYYSGGPVAGANAEWSVIANPFYFTPPDDLSSYSFAALDQDNGYTQNPGPSTQVIAQGSGQTDANGRLTLNLPADLSAISSDLRTRTGQTLTIEATLTDVSKNAVSNRADVTVHLSQVYPGVKTSTYVGTAGKEQSFDVVLVDWNGKPLPSGKVNVEIVERRWYSVQEQDATGRIQWSSTVQDIPVTSFKDVALDAQGKATVKFTPPKGGIYRALVTASDAHGNLGRASAYTWVAAADFIPWQQTNDRSFTLIADRTTYSPGDTAEILIASPFEGDAYALVTIERGHIRKQEVLHLTTNSTIYKLPITPDLAPNAYVSVLVVKGVDASNPRPNFKMGVTQIKVEPRQQQLQVQLSVDKPQAGPGDRVTFTIRTLDMDNKPVSAELSLGLSDLATLSLTEPNSAPILDYFYYNRTLGVWTSVPIVQSIEDYNATIREHLSQGGGMGSGGGKGSGELGVIAVRQNFPDTAYWTAHLVTGANGEATAEVTLPDNLTTWRLDARAVTVDTRVGQSRLDLVSSRPLLVRPQTPRFFIPGDAVTLGAAVNNNTDQTLSVNVSLEGSGLTLQSPASQQVQLNARSQAYVAWNATVNADASRVDLVFTAQGGGLTDASRPPMGTLDNQGLPVYRFTAHETVGTSGQLTAAGSHLEAISLPSEIPVSAGTLTVRLSPSLAAGMTDGLKYLESYPYEGTEQTISSFLPNVVTIRALRAANQSKPELESALQTQVSIGLQHLENWQNPDGGWGWWHGMDQKSDPLTSAYAVLGLVEAKEAGFPVTASMLDRAVQYLHLQIVPVAGLTETHLLNLQSFILYAVARAGSPSVSSTVEIYDQRQSLAVYARAFLANTLSLIDPQDPRLKTLLSDFATLAVTSATGTHWEEKDPDWWNWNTDTRTTAIVLVALSRLDPANPLNANAVRWLMSNRSEGHWMGTQETAWTLMGLTSWMVASNELSANYNYGVALNGDQINSGTANTENLRQTVELKVDVSGMLKDQANRLVFARDGGPGNLYYTAFLDLSLPAEQSKSLNQGVIVSRSYFPQKADKTGVEQSPVTTAKQGDLLLVRLTVVAPNALHYLTLEDPLPAGLEGVDQSLLTSPQNVEVPQVYTWDDVFLRGWGWWNFDRIQMRDEKSILSATYLPAGTYIYTYLARASTPGTFKVVPPTAQETYFPEVYGRGDGSVFVVTP